jgi:hypothetical protein
VNKNENYIKLRVWLSENELSFGQGISFFIDESNIAECRRAFKNGDFIFHDRYKHLAVLYKTLLNKIMNVCNGKKNPWIQQGFVRAFMVFLKNEEIDVKRLFEQIDKYPFMVSARPSKQLNLEMLYEVYNYRRHTKVDM